MSMLTNSIRPAEHSALATQCEATQAMHEEFKLRGICARCNTKTYSITYSGHPIFKMVCPGCKAVLAAQRQQRKVFSKK